MTAHGLRQLPPTVSGCFVFVFAIFVFVFFLKNSWNVYVCCPAIPGSAVNYTLGTQSVACFCFFFCFELISFCLVFEDETKGSTQKGEKGDQVTVSLITMPREKSLFAFHVWTPSNGSRKKKKKSPLPVWLVHAQHDFLFREEQLNFTCVSAFRSAFVACAKGDAHSIVCFTYVRWLATTQRGDNSWRCKQVAKVTNAITKWKFKVQL